MQNNSNNDALLGANSGMDLSGRSTSSTGSQQQQQQPQAYSTIMFGSSSSPSASSPQQQQRIFQQQMQQLQQLEQFRQAQLQQQSNSTSAPPQPILMFGNSDSFPQQHQQQPSTTSGYSSSSMPSPSAQQRQLFNQQQTATMLQQIQQQQQQQQAFAHSNSDSTNNSTSLMGMVGLPPSPPLTTSSPPQQTQPDTHSKTSNVAMVAANDPTGDSAVASAPTPTSGPTAKPSSSSHARPATHSLAPLPLEQQAELLDSCNWMEKALWCSRQLLGGQAVNGFMRATATVQRIKKQRARQVHKTKENQKEPPPPAPRAANEQEAEEILKKEIMNVRTAKKLKTEFEQGLQFTELLHKTIRAMLVEMDDTLPPVPSLNSPRTSASALASTTAAASRGSARRSNNSNPKPSVTSGPSAAAVATTVAATSSTATGSSLRRYRKQKVPPTNEQLPLLELDPVSGKRTCTKKEYTNRLAMLWRFRSLSRGDPVAARPTSRDLWILAKVVQDCPVPHNLSHANFLKLSSAKRDALFRNCSVRVRDVEENDATVSVDRTLVLPLPRNVSEATEWAIQLLKKGSRVYAMYPQTTSLYTATVVDCTTYCRGLEDIIVVEFDGDEPDGPSGKLPTHHIPARFVVPVPREFQVAVQSEPTATSNNNGKKRKTSSSSSHSMNVSSAMLNDNSMDSVLDELNLESDLPGLGDDGFDDLDFDLFS